MSVRICHKHNYILYIIASEANQDTTHQPTTDNQLHWLYTDSIITNCKTNECYGVPDLDIQLFTLHIVLVYPL
jgi:hypothetical protein